MRALIYAYVCTYVYTVSMLTSFMFMWILQIVVDVDRLPDEFKKVLADVRDGKVKPTVLPPWDPMGALAKL